MKQRESTTFYDMVIPPAMARARHRARVVISRHGRLALELERETNVAYVPMAQEGETFRLADLPPKMFDAEYKAVEGFPIERAAALFVGYVLDRGSTPEVMEALATLVHVSAQDKEKAMAKAKGAAAGEAPKKKGGTAGKKTAAPKKNGTKAAAPTAAPKPAKEPKPRKRTAAAAFRELIMKGGQTDDAIFAAVKKEFSLDDDQRSYVAWYRNDLRKRGETPPEPVKPAQEAAK